MPSLVSYILVYVCIFFIFLFWNLFSLFYLTFVMVFNRNCVCVFFIWFLCVLYCVFAPKYCLVSFFFNFELICYTFLISYFFHSDNPDDLVKIEFSGSEMRFLRRIKAVTLLDNVIDIIRWMSSRYFFALKDHSLYRLAMYAECPRKDFESRPLPAIRNGKSPVEMVEPDSETLGEIAWGSASSRWRSR